MTTDFGTAVATGDDGHETGVEVARAATSRMDEEPSGVDFCQVFCSPEYDVTGVVAGIREVIGEDAELIGCTSAGEFTERESRDKSVAVGLIASDTHRFFTGLGTGLSDDLAGCIEEAAAEFPDRVEGYPHLSVINLHDGLAGVGERIALATQRRLGQHVSVAGGSAGDDLEMESTLVFRNDEVADDAVALALIASKRPVVITVSHGHEPVSEPLEVTAAEGNSVLELDGRPAFDVWRDAVRETAREEYGIDVDDLAEGSDDLARALNVFEFGIDQGDSYKIRWPGMTTSTAGPVDFTVSIPEGTVLRVMHSPPEAQVESASAAADEAREAIGDDRIAGAFVYDCVCRSAILGDEFPTAIEAISDRLGAPMVGFETYGEMCMQRGQLSGYHNTTSVVMLLPD